MSVGSVILKILDYLFAGAELVSDVNDRLRKRKREQPGGLTMRELLDLKRQEDERVRRSQAPTVVIPPPSERRAIPPPPPKRR